MAKPRRRHPEKALSPMRIKAASEPGRYADGNGLYLVVDPSGAKRWVLRTVVHGRRRDIGLGGLSVVPLAEARTLAAQYRGMARNGGDPVAVRRAAKRVVATFEEAARAVHAASWRNAKHSAQWINTLAEYVVPAIGARRIDQIETPDLLRVLSPIWLTKPETARRVKQRIAVVFDWAKAAGHRNGDNPVSGLTKGLPKQPERQTHHAALPYALVPNFVARLRKDVAADVSRLAFEFLILTAARTGEVLEARWSEINLDGAVWTIPADRMKARREHRVPLAPQAVAILRHARELGTGDDFVFADLTGKKPLSNMVFLMRLRRMNVAATTHGFRSAFRDWAAERTNFPREVCELALGRAISDKVEAAYRRGDLFIKRRKLMTAWADYLTNTATKVVSLRTA